MNRNSAPFVVVLFLTVALAGLTLAFVEGTLGIVAAGLGGGLAVAAWRRNRPAGAPQQVATRWWKVLGAGLGLLALVIVTTTVTGELSQAGWYVASD